MFKFITIAKRIISGFGAFCAGCFAAVMIECAVVDWTLLLGLGLGLVLAVCPNLDLDIEYVEDEMPEDRQGQDF